jgi:hypothetical protein
MMLYKMKGKKFFRFRICILQFFLIQKRYKSKVFCGKKRGEFRPLSIFGDLNKNCTFVNEKTIDEIKIININLLKHGEFKTRNDHYK